jgi:hypothetical protein
MKTFTINIGLNNNPFVEKRNDGAPSIVQETILNILKLAFPYASEFYRIETGEWDGEKEPTFVGYIDADESTIDRKVQLLCDIMTQICIPYSSDSKSNLVYESYYTGERFDFNKEYFIY